MPYKNYKIKQSGGLSTIQDAEIKVLLSPFFAWNSCNAPLYDSSCFLLIRKQAVKKGCKFK